MGRRRRLPHVHLARRARHGATCASSRSRCGRPWAPRQLSSRRSMHNGSSSYSRRSRRSCRCNSSNNRSPRNRHRSPANWRVRAVRRLPCSTCPVRHPGWRPLSRRVACMPSPRAAAAAVPTPQPPPRSRQPAASSASAPPRRSQRLAAPLVCPACPAWQASLWQGLSPGSPRWHCRVGARWCCHAAAAGWAWNPTPRVPAWRPACRRRCGQAASA